MPPTWPPAVLTPAVVLISFETTVEVLLVLGRSDLRVSLRLVLAVCLAVKFVFAAMLIRRSAAALLALLLWELTALLVAIAATGWHDWVRAGMAVLALAGLVLLVAVMRAFPEPALPPPTKATAA